MAHELWEGDQMAFRLETGLPWHYGETGEDGRAVAIAGDGPITADQMLDASGLGWTVSMQPVYWYVRGLNEASRDGLVGDAYAKLCDEAGEDEEVVSLEDFFEEMDVVTRRRGDVYDVPMAIPGQWAVVRDDRDAVLGVVGDKYVPMQNAEAFQFLEALVGEGELDYETAGSLMGGRKIWVLAKPPASLFPVEGVELVPFLLLSSSHDGSSAIRVRFTTVNVVCNNTLTAALGENGVEFSIRHTAAATSEVMIESARRVLDLAAQAWGQLEADVIELVGAPFSEEEFETFAKILVPSTKKDGAITAQAKKTHAFLRWAFVNSPGNERAPAKGTAWAALNAVTYFTTHAVTSRVTGARKGRVGGDEEACAEAHMESTMFGASERMARRAHQLLLDYLRTREWADE